VIAVEGSRESALWEKTKMANAKPSLVVETFTGSAAKYVLFDE